MLARPGGHWRCYRLPQPRPARSGPRGGYPHLRSSVRPSRRGVAAPRRSKYARAHLVLYQVHTYTVCVFGLISKNFQISLSNLNATRTVRLDSVTLQECVAIGMLLHHCLYPWPALVSSAPTTNHFGAGPTQAAQAYCRSKFFRITVSSPTSVYWTTQEYTRQYFRECRNPPILALAQCG